MSCLCCLTCDVLFRKKRVRRTHTWSLIVYVRVYVCILYMCVYCICVYIVHFSSTGKRFDYAVCQKISFINTSKRLFLRAKKINARLVRPDWSTLTF